MMSWALSDAFDGEGHSLEYYFDALYLSYKLKMMKPCEKIFNLILEKENIGINTLCPANGEDWTDALYERIRSVNEFR